MRLLFDNVLTVLALGALTLCALVGLLALALLFWVIASRDRRWRPHGYDRGLRDL